MRKITFLGLIAFFMTFLNTSAQNAWINEIHYDNNSTDVAEMVEVVIENAGLYALSNFTVTPYNGSGGVTYGTAVTLDNFTVGDVVGNYSIFYFIYPLNGLQNGSPDGLSLDYLGTLIAGQFLSYEGSFLATNGPANGITSTDIGVSESSTSTVGYSLQLSGAGSVYGDFTWQAPATATAGSSNNGQTLVSLGGNIPPLVSSIAITPPSDITSTTTVSVSADIIDSDGTIALAELHWGTISGSLTNTINMTLSTGDTYTTDADIPAQIDGTAVYYEIAATDNEPETTTTPEYNYIVNDPATTALPYSEDFATGFGDCYAYNVAGTTNWSYYATGQIVQANGYSSPLEEEWLVLPGIDLDSYSNEVMTFTTTAKYGTNNATNYLKLFYSTDYFGIGDPTGATWTELTYNQPNIVGTTEETALSGNVDLSGISGTNVYLAFKYYSTNSPTRWGVDNILIGETLDWYNLQWVSFEVMPSWYNADVYAQASKTGITDPAGQGAGIECWIGYSTIDEDPSLSSNFTFLSVNYFGDSGPNDEYKGVLGADIPMAPGTYYIVARWSYLGGPFVYGGYGGSWSNNSAYLNIYESAAATTWTGLVDDNWFNGGNWDNDVPGYNTDATIPVGLTNYPLTTGGTAMCNNILVQSDPAGDASLIEYGNLNVLGTATVEKYLTSGFYHSYSPSVSGLTSGLFHLPGSTGLDVYLYSHNELNNGDAFGGYFEITDLVTGLTPMDGYAVFVNGEFATPPVQGWTFMQEGPLNSGLFGTADNMTRTGAGLYAGFNYVGNPYPSYIDWDAVAGWDKTQMNGTIYMESTGTWAEYTNPGPGINGASNIIAPGQGFFVEVNSAFASGSIKMDNTVRTNTTTSYLKSTATNYIKLAAIGNEKTDEMVVRFDENATALFDGQYDGAKLAAGDDSYPQIYSIADRDLAYNALPETDLVQLGFRAGIDGEYVISAIEISDIPSVWLEDTFNGVFTNLTTDSYSFSYTTADDLNRFVLHFSPLAISENISDLFNIYAANDEIVISSTSGLSAQVFVYNIMGQEIATAQINGKINKLKMNNSSVYVVKVVSEQGVVSKKVYIK